MTDNLVALLSFVNEAEKYVSKNASKNLGDLSNIDLSKLKKELADHISSFELVDNASSIETGKVAFADYLKNSIEIKKKNVLDELGQIFDVNFDDGIDDETEAQQAISDIVGVEETVSENEQVEETVPEIEQVQETISETKQVEEIVPSTETVTEVVLQNDDGEDIDEVIETIKEKVDAEEIGPVKNDEEIVEESSIEENFVEENSIEESPVEENSIEESYVEEPLNEPLNNDEVVATIVDIVHEAVGYFEVIEDNTEENEKLIEDLKSAYDDLEEEYAEEKTEPTEEVEEVVEEVLNEPLSQDDIVLTIVKIVNDSIGIFTLPEEKVEEETETVENNFGLNDDDEILQAIRLATSSVDTNSDEKEEEPLFQPAPADLDSIFEEVEANKQQIDEEKIKQTEYDILSSLGGILNYGQFDNLDNNETEDEETQESQEIENYEPMQSHYILNPLSEEAGSEYLLDENDKDSSDEKMADEESDESEKYQYHFIENPGLDVVFNNDDVVYSSYDKKDDQDEEVKTETVNDLNTINQIESQETDQVPLDEDDQYVDDLLSNIEFSKNKVNDILDEREQTYKVIARMYPYLKYAFIKSAYNLKESIANEYKVDEKIIMLHRGKFADIEDLRKYAEVMMYHDYQVNVDEDKMIVDALKPLINADGLILNSIFDVANQISLLGGNYEGYCVLTNDKE